MKLFRKLAGRSNLADLGKTAWAVAIMSGIGGIGWCTSFTYLSLYLYQERHIAMTAIGLVLLISGFASAACEVIGGITGDRFGYRRMVVLYSSAGILASAGQAFLIGTGAPTWSVLLVSVLVPTLGGMGIPSMNAIMANASQKDRMTESYSLLAITGNIAWAIGPLLGGYLLPLTSYAWLFGVGTVIKALALFAIPFLPADKPARPGERIQLGGFNSLFSNPTLIIFSAISIFFYLTMTQWAGTLSVFTVDRIGFSTQQYGLLMTVSGVLIVTFQYPISHRIKTADLRKALIMGCLFYSAGFLSLTWVKAFIPAVGSIVIMVIGEMLFVPTALSVVGLISRPEDRGKSMGIFGLCSTLGFSSGPLLGGFLLDQYPGTPLFLWGPVALSSLIAALGFTLWKGYVRKISAGDGTNEPVAPLNPSTSSG